ncbi:MAG: hypothetical protein AAGH68_11305 [Pseudomonadota bacterium]
MMQTTTAPVTGAPRQTWIFSLLCILLPLGLYFGIFWLVLHNLQPTKAELSALEFVPTNQPAILTELPARLDYGLLCALFILAALASTVYVLVVMRQSLGARLTLAALGLAASFGVVVFLADDHIEQLLRANGLAMLASLVGVSDTSIGESLRYAATAAVLEGVSHSGVAPDTKRVHDIYLLAAITAAIGVFSVTLMALRFAEVAWRPTGPQDARALRQRWRSFRTVLVFAAIVLTLSVATNKAFYNWPLGLLEEKFREAYGAITGAAIGFWGTLYTMILISVAGPALLSLALDIDRVSEAAARDAPPEKKTTPAAWRKAHGLVLAPREALSGMLAVAAPLLTSPAMDALGAAFG